MTKRPVFVPSPNNPVFVKEEMIEFKWIPGFALTQQQKCILSLHQAAELKGFKSILEISTKSPLEIGKELSAFRLMLKLPDGRSKIVEAAFQASKVFKQGGPYTDLLEKEGKEIKADPRLRESGELTGFNYFGEQWQLEPKTAFYDWLYLTALSQQPGLAEKLLEFEGFTDIAFNPEKSINCQAHAAAFYVVLKRKGILVSILSNRNNYFELLKQGKIKKEQQISLL